MPTQSIRINRKRKKFECDPSRVIAKYFCPGDEKRLKRLIRKLILLTETACRNSLAEIIADFSNRHHDFETILMTNFERIDHFIPSTGRLSKIRKMLMGAYVTHEYSVESVALINPSMVQHPDQSGLPAGSVRFVLSFRAIGEGHISSIVFRSGTIDFNHKLVMDSVSSYIETPRIELNPNYDRHTFLLKLDELRIHNKYSDQIFAELDDVFDYHALKESIENVEATGVDSMAFSETIEIIDWVAQSNYEESFRPETSLSERVIFPVSANESKGIEDARFVQFLDDNQDPCYFATYTAFNGHTIVPMLLETKDFLRFRICTLNGKEAYGKGMALFPRKVNGHYSMISRQDGENIFLMQSDNLHFWQDTVPLKTPDDPWELVQVGNCGSPIESEKGWLLVTHGVGPMRRYCISAMLLDLHNPTKVIGQLKEPLIVPNDYEREGYVPNVVYSCGGMVYNRSLVLPYAISDTSSAMATIDLDQILNCMLQNTKPKRKRTTKKK